MAACLKTVMLIALSNSCFNLVFFRIRKECYKVKIQYGSVLIFFLLSAVQLC